MTEGETSGGHPGFRLDQGEAREAAKNFFWSWRFGGGTNPRLGSHLGKPAIPPAPS
jgi:hypothetical protein